jgi:hypothetical protein
MPVEKRTELQQEMIKALIESKAIDFEAAGGVLAKYGARAALEGNGLAFNINWRVVRDICIPPVTIGLAEAAEE